VVYLIHFEQPIPRGVSPAGKPLVAQHYIGYADDVPARLAQHAAGRGARLMAVVRERGIRWALVRTWPGGRQAERQIKRRKEAPRLCPICNPDDTPPEALDW
jgi:hypothetical protein